MSKVKVYPSDYTKKVGVYCGEKLISKHCDFYHAQIAQNSKENLRKYGNNLTIKALNK
jgi:hypothetical protein